MAVAKKKRVRRKPTANTPTAVRRRRSRPMAAAPKRRRRGLGDGGKVGIMAAGKTTLGGAMGGALYVAPQFVVALPWWGKLIVGGGISMAAAMLKFPSIGAGAAGAAMLDLAKDKMSMVLKDDMDDAEFVDADTLSDTGFCDEDGNGVVMDDDGVVYSLQDNGDYQAIGMAEDVFSLQDTLSEDEFPMSDAYSLSESY